MVHAVKLVCGSPNSQRDDHRKWFSCKYKVFTSELMFLYKMPESLLTPSEGGQKSNAVYKKKTKSDAHWPWVFSLCCLLTAWLLNLCCINYNELEHNENSDYNGPDENLELLPKVTDCVHSQETICWTLLTSIRDLALLESLWVL